MLDRHSIYWALHSKIKIVIGAHWNKSVYIYIYITGRANYVNDLQRMCMMIIWNCRVPTSESWWRHQMETFSALLAICAGNSPVPGEGQWRGALMFSAFDKRLRKQSWVWWLETLLCPLWRHCNDISMHPVINSHHRNKNPTFLGMVLTSDRMKQYSRLRHQTTVYCLDNTVIFLLRRIDTTMVCRL